MNENSGQHQNLLCQEEYFSKERYRVLVYGVASEVFCTITILWYYRRGVCTVFDVAIALNLHYGTNHLIRLSSRIYCEALTSPPIHFWMMTDSTVIRSVIPLGEIQHAALEHDIRQAQTHKELIRSNQKSDILDTYRAELLEKVNAHICELQHLNESSKRTSIFKGEMMEKVNEHLAEVEKEQHKKEEVARLREELIAKVHAHAEELDRIDAKKSNLSLYKAELLAKVDERAQEIEHAHQKEAQVQKFSDEMKIKVHEHEAHLADRANMMESLKEDIIKSARNFYGGAYCVDESA